MVKKGFNRVLKEDIEHWKQKFKEGVDSDELEASKFH